MGRFYTNPFQKDAPMVAQVSATEPIYDGITLLARGFGYRSWSRDVTYSDGTVRREEVRHEPLDEWEVVFGHISGKGFAIRRAPESAPQPSLPASPAPDA